MSKLIDRIIRASKLDANLYEEVEARAGLENLDKSEGGLK
jgi:hypothetical protein